MPARQNNRRVCQRKGRLQSLCVVPALGALDELKVRRLYATSFLDCGDRRHGRRRRRRHGGPFRCVVQAERAGSGARRAGRSRRQQARARRDDARSSGAAARSTSFIAPRRCSIRCPKTRTGFGTRTPPSPMQPSYATNEYRSMRPAYLVLVGVCTHLGLCAAAALRGGARGPRPRLAGRLLLPVPRLEIRSRGTRFRGRAGADEPDGAAVPLRQRQHDSDRLGYGERVNGEHRSRYFRPARSRAERVRRLDRRSVPDDEAHQGARHRVLRVEELQFLVRLRRARDGRAGHADRHRHLPDDELQAVGRRGVRVGRVHHARCRLGLADPLPALDGRVGVLHRRLSAHVPRAACTARTRSRASWSG